MKNSLDDKRTNIDVMRAVLMGMVVVTHYLLLNRALPSSGPDEPVLRTCGMILEALCLVDVNGFVLMSGFLRVRSGFRAGRFLELVMTVVCYGCLIYLIAMACGLTENNDGLFGLVQKMLPVSSEHYWFMTAFLMLYLLTPFLNAGMQALPEKTLRTVLFLLLVWNCLIKSIVPVNLMIDDMGYGLQWLICMYLTGGYLRLYVWEKESPAWKRFARYGGLIYLCCALVIAFMTVGLWQVVFTTGKLEWYASVPAHLNFLLQYISAIAFFMWFVTLRFPGGVFAKAAARISPHVLGVYLLHAHPALFSNWIRATELLTGPAPRENIPLFLLHLIVSVALVFIAGILADVLRDGVFRLVIRTFSGKRTA